MDLWGTHPRRSKHTGDFCDTSDFLRRSSRNTYATTPKPRHATRQSTGTRTSKVHTRTLIVSQVLDVKALDPTHATFWPLHSVSNHRNLKLTRIARENKVCWKAWPSHISPKKYNASWMFSWCFAMSIRTCPWFPLRRSWRVLWYSSRAHWELQVWFKELPGVYKKLPLGFLKALPDALSCYVAKISWNITMSSQGFPEVLKNLSGGVSEILKCALKSSLLSVFKTHT